MVSKYFNKELIKITVKNYSANLVAEYSLNITFYDSQNHFNSIRLRFPQ